MLEVYIIAPTGLTENGEISTRFDIPDDIAGRDYFVEVYSPPVDQSLPPDDPRNWGNDVLKISGGGGNQKIASLSGIGAGLKYGITGSTTARGINRIQYSSEGL
jgi:hypothetical protein